MLKYSSSARSVASLLLAAVSLAAGCRAQVPPPGANAKMTPELSRRIALMIRTKAQLPFNYDVKVGDRKPSSVSGYDEVTIFLGEDGKPLRPMVFLLSDDNKTLAQMNTFDITKDPRTLVSDAGRPSRGGAESAPVTIVVYDDLECPFCARMHTQIFPALLDRYGKNVRIAYKDFPLSTIHPWAIHAAVDADCLAQQSPTGYWNLVDYVHLHVDEVGVDTSVPADKEKGPQRTLIAATKQIDHDALEEGRRQKVDVPKLQTCIQHQDEAAVRSSMKEGDALNITGVPALFINGEQITGAVPVEYVYRAVDEALKAQGITPPPPVPLPSLDAPAGAPPAASGAQ